MNYYQSLRIPINFCELIWISVNYCAKWGAGQDSLDVAEGLFPFENAFRWLPIDSVGFKIPMDSCEFLSIPLNHSEPVSITINKYELLWITMNYYELLWIPITIHHYGLLSITMNRGGTIWTSQKALPFPTALTSRTICTTAEGASLQRYWAEQDSRPFLWIIMISYDSYFE